MLTQEQALKLIRLERKYQDKKWGDLETKNQSYEGFVLVAQGELKEVVEGWLKNGEGRSHTLAEMVQLAAVCVAALESYGEYSPLYSLYDDELMEAVRKDAKGYVAELERDNDYLHDRLEDNAVYDSGGNLVRCEPGSIPDGIECRNETIRGLDRLLDEKNEEIQRLKEQLSRKGQD